MVDVQVRVKGVENLAELNRRFPELLPRVLTHTAGDGVRILKQVTPRDTGQARRAWLIRKSFSSAQSEVAIYNQTKHIEYQEEGTGIHGPRGRRIRPTQKRFLAWNRWKRAPVKPNKKGWWVFSSVAGVKARHFVRDSLPEIGKKLQSNFILELEKLLSTLLRKKEV